MSDAGKCLLSMRRLQPGRTHDRAAAEALFGMDTVPSLDVELAKLHTLGLAMVGQTSVSGAKRKLSLGLDNDRGVLRLQAGGRQYILKPKTDRFPALPESEQVAMAMANACGIEVAPNGLIRLVDGSVAFITLRFDRDGHGRKHRMEDFCQLAERHPAEKYRGSAELCVRLVQR